MAEGLAEGKTQSAIAIDCAVSRETVNRDAQTPDVRQILLDMVAARRVRIDGLADQVLDVIAAALGANRSVVVPLLTYDAGKPVSRSSEVLDLGVDHYARLAGAKRWMELVTRGRPIPKPADVIEERRWSLQDLLWAIQEERRQAGLPPDPRYPDNP